MNFLSLNSDLIIAGVILVLAIIIIFVAIYFYNRNVNVHKYKRTLKFIMKQKEKKYNANVFIDLLANKYTTDATNTYRSLKGKGKRKVKKYIKFYQDQLNELVIRKSNISPNKRMNKLMLIFKNQDNKDIGRFYIKDRFKKLIKIIDKNQLLFDVIAYFFELPTYIDSQKIYHLENHDNHHIITYQIKDVIK
jgi:hypothetical protein